MKKVTKILCVLLALTILMFTSTAYATDFVYDDTKQQYITKSESKQLDTVAKNYRDNFGFGIYYYYANEVNGNLVDFSEEYYKQYCNNDENGVLLALTDEKYFIYLNGDAEEIFSDTDEVWDAFSSCETYYDGVAAYINYVGTEVVKYYGGLPEEKLTDPQPETEPIENKDVLTNNTLKSDGALVFDHYDLLSADEENALEIKLRGLSSKHGMDIAVVIVDGLDGKTPEEFADDYYDYNGYGQNETCDGVVLLLSMADRDWHFTTTGKAIEVFTDKAQNYIFNKNVLSYFKDNDWIGGFNSYADECDKCLVAFESGEKYPPVSFADAAKYIGVSAVIGIIAALVFVSSVKKKHETVTMKASANDYLVPGSLQLTQSYDNFAYKNVTRTRKADNNSGGSSTHSSSSGRTHGGSGGKF